MKTRLIFIVLCASISFQANLRAQEIYYPSERILLDKHNIRFIEAWRIDHKTGKRELESKFIIDREKGQTTEISYFDFHNNPVEHVKDEVWSDDKKEYEFFETEKDSTGTTRKIVRRKDFYSDNKFMYKRITESWPDVYQRFTVWIDEKNPGYLNNELIKIRLPADTFQYIVNKQDYNHHEYFIKEKLNGQWVITENSLTRYKNGEYYSYENYRNGKLMNKFTADTIMRAADTLLSLDDDFFEHGLPHLEHAAPSDTTWSTEKNFKNKKLITKKPVGNNQYKRIRLFMDEEKSDQIEEWIYDPRGLLVIMDILYADYSNEYVYK